MRVSGGTWNQSHEGTNNGVVSKMHMKIQNLFENKKYIGIANMRQRPIDQDSMNSASLQIIKNVAQSRGLQNRTQDRIQNTSHITIRAENNGGSLANNHTTNISNRLMNNSCFTTSQSIPLKIIQTGQNLSEITSTNKIKAPTVAYITKSPKRIITGPINFEMKTKNHNPSVGQLHEQQQQQQPTNSSRTRKGKKTHKTNSLSSGQMRLSHDSFFDELSSPELVSNQTKKNSLPRKPKKKCKKMESFALCNSNSSNRIKSIERSALQRIDVPLMAKIKSISSEFSPQFFQKLKKKSNNRLFLQPTHQQDKSESRSQHPENTHTIQKVQSIGCFRSPLEHSQTHVASTSPLSELHAGSLSNSFITSTFKPHSFLPKPQIASTHPSQASMQLNDLIRRMQELNGFGEGSSRRDDCFYTPDQYEEYLNVLQEFSKRQQSYEQKAFVESLLEFSKRCFAQNMNRMHHKNEDLTKIKEMYTPSTQIEENHQNMLVEQVGLLKSQLDDQNKLISSMQDRESTTAAYLQQLQKTGYLPMPDLKNPNEQQDRQKYAQSLLLQKIIKNKLSSISTSQIPPREEQEITDRCVLTKNIFRNHFLQLHENSDENNMRGKAKNLVKILEKIQTAKRNNSSIAPLKNNSTQVTPLSCTPLLKLSTCTLPNKNQAEVSAITPPIFNMSPSKNSHQRDSQNVIDLQRKNMHQSKISSSSSSNDLSSSYISSSENNTEQEANNKVIQHQISHANHQLQKRQGQTMVIKSKSSTNLKDNIRQKLKLDLSILRNNQNVNVANSQLNKTIEGGPNHGLSSQTNNLESKEIPVLDYYDEFMSKIDEFSLSWRKAVIDESKKHQNRDNPFIQKHLS